MNKLLRITVGLAAAIVLAAAAVMVSGAGPVYAQTIEAKALIAHGCDSSEWHFVINQISNEGLAPANITVTWANGDVLVISLEKFTGKVAHYTTYANLDSTVTSATTEIYDGWGGQFNLSHGPCGEPMPTPTPTPMPTPSPIPTPTPTPESTLTPTPEPTVTPTPTFIPTVTPTPTPRSIVTPTPAPTVTPTATSTYAEPTPEVTPTPEITSTPTPDFPREFPNTGGGGMLVLSSEKDETGAGTFAILAVISGGLITVGLLLILRPWR